MPIFPINPAELKRIRTNAEYYVYSLDDLHAILKDPAKSAGNDSRFTAILGDLKVVFTIEEQKIGRTRHLSMSLPWYRRSPPIAVVEIVMQELGFEATLKTPDRLYVYEDKTCGAINIIELISEHVPAAASI